MMANNTIHRRDNWVDSVRKQPELLATFKDGSQIDAHPSLISYREKSDNANIYLRTQMTSADRANLAQFTHSQNHLS